MINLNIVYSVYFTPRTKEEIADELGLTLVFIEDRINMLCACIDNVCIRSLQKWNYENEESDKRIGIALYLFGVDCANYYGLD